MTNDVATSLGHDSVTSSANPPDPGGTHTAGPNPLVWPAGRQPVDVLVRGAAEPLTRRPDIATVREREGRVDGLESGTPHGREVLRGIVARGGETLMAAPRGRSRLGLDLAKFTAWIVSQPARRPRGRGTRSLGPMPVDANLMLALEGFCARHDVSKRLVVECLLTELLAGDVPTNPVSGERE